MINPQAQENHYMEREPFVVLIYTFNRSSNVVEDQPNCVVVNTRLSCGDGPFRLEYESHPHRAFLSADELVKTYSRQTTRLLSLTISHLGPLSDFVRPS